MLHTFILETADDEYAIQKAPVRFPTEVTSCEKYFSLRYAQSCEFREILASVFYPLLHIHRLAGLSPWDGNVDACHLGLLARMATVPFQFGHP